MLGKKCFRDLVELLKTKLIVKLGKKNQTKQKQKQKTNLIQTKKTQKNQTPNKPYVDY